MWVAILIFFNEQKSAAASEETRETAAPHADPDLKTQAAHAAHQPQAARSQPNARGAVGQLCGAVRKRAAGVPEAHVGRQPGLQHPMPHRGQQPLAHGLEREFRVEDTLGRVRQLLDQIGLGRLPEEPRASCGRRLQSSRCPWKKPWAPMGFSAKPRSAKTAAPGSRSCHPWADLAVNTGTLPATTQPPFCLWTHLQQRPQTRVRRQWKNSAFTPPSNSFVGSSWQSRTLAGRAPCGLTELAGSVLSSHPGSAPFF